QADRDARYRAVGARLVAEARRSVANHHIRGLEKRIEVAHARTVAGNRAASAVVTGIDAVEIGCYPGAVDAADSGARTGRSRSIADVVVGTDRNCPPCNGNRSSL